MYAFFFFASGYRRRRSLETGLQARGLARMTLVLYVSFLTKHVLPSLYPQMVDVQAGGMGRDVYRAFVNDLLHAVQGMFTEDGQEALGAQAAAQAGAVALPSPPVHAVAAAGPQACALAQGLQDEEAAGTAVGAAVAQEAAALSAGRAAVEGRRAQTGKPRTAVHTPLGRTWCWCGTCWQGSRLGGMAR